MKQPAMRRTKRPEHVDPVRLRIYDNLFSAVAEEMGAALCRLGFSPNITERRDYSTALFDARGAMVAQAAHVPVHLGSMPLSVACALERLELGPGDVGLLNDPFEGGTHLPDLTVVAPVFLDNGRRPSFFVANRAHHADVGGTTGGSLALSTEIYHEGLRIPPVKYVEAGRRNDDLHRLFVANMRNPSEREGDLSAQLAALSVGTRRLLELVERNGRQEVTAFAHHLQDYAERLMRKTIAAIPDGRYSFSDRLDDDGVVRRDSSKSRQRRPLIQALISIEQDRTTIDFAGTDDQLPGNLNANRAVTLSAIFYVFRCLGGEAMPSNAGCMRPLEVKIPKGSLLNAVPPAAVAAGNVETSQRIVDVLLGALSRAVPTAIPAASQGTMNNLTISGVDPRDGRPFTYYETIAGGMGARPAADGLSAVHTHMTNTLNTPIEALETAYPLRVNTYAIRRGSAGRGRQRGGEGVVREIELLAPAEVAFLGERQREGPRGARGGGAAKPGAVWVTVNGRRRRVPGKFHAFLPAGARIRVETPGGGGYGRGG